MDNKVSNYNSAISKDIKRKSEIRGWIISLAVAVIIALGLRFFVFELINVKGDSMQKTLYSGEYLFVEKVTYYFSAPSRGDIIICSYPDSTDSFVKRVIGLPGDVIEINEGVLYINGVANSDYYKGYINKHPVPNPITVPLGCVFVMGDNRNDSRDSRDPSVGPIPYNKILGKALFVIWPPDKIRGV